MQQKPSFFDILDRVIDFCAEIGGCDVSVVHPDSYLTQDPLRLTPANIDELAQRLNESYANFKLQILGDDIRKQATFVIQVVDLVATKIGVPIPNTTANSISPVENALRQQAHNLNIYLDDSHIEQIKAATLKILGSAAAESANIPVQDFTNKLADPLIRAQEAKLRRD